jgi:hypothetical protein
MQGKISANLRKNAKNAESRTLNAQRHQRSALSVLLLAMIRS